jgi:NADH-quinone oxidoreductase subunit A
VDRVAGPLIISDLPEDEARKCPSPGGPPTTMATPIAIVAYLALFAAVGAVFLFANLLLGRFLRPNNPNEEKLEIYECGEPAIGSSFVQFDLRYYVVALVFLIFDVEIAFFFPWATVYGKASHLADPALHNAVVTAPDVRQKTVEGLYGELGVPAGDAIINASSKEIIEQSTRLMHFSLIDIGVFFVVLLVGFAYVWKRGDLDWVRAVSQDQLSRAPPTSEEKPVMSA